MIEAQKVAAFVFDALKNDATFSAAVGGRVFRDQVPQGAALPAAVVSVVTSTDANTLGGVRAYDVVLIDVRIVGSGANYGPINAPADRADAILQNRAGVSGGVVIVELRRDQVQAFVENESGTAFAHLLSTYRTEAYAAA